MMWGAARGASAEGFLEISQTNLQGLTFYNFNCLLEVAGSFTSPDLVRHSICGREHEGDRCYKLRAVKSQHRLLLNCFRKSCWEAWPDSGHGIRPKDAGQSCGPILCQFDKS